MQYVAPPPENTQFNALTRARSSSGAGLTLYLLGVGLNAATLWWLSRLVGARRTLSVALVAVSTCLALGWISEPALCPTVQADADMHALESLARPHLYGENAAAMAHATLNVLEPLWNSAVPVLLVLSVTGMLLRWLSVERLGCRVQPSPTSAPREDMKRWHRRSPKE